MLKRFKKEFKLFFYFSNKKMQADSEIRHIPNIFPDYLPEKTELNPLYNELSETLSNCLQEFYKKVKPSEPISICSVKSKSTYSYSIFDGFILFITLISNIFNRCWREFISLLHYV